MNSKQIEKLAETIKPRLEANEIISIDELVDSANVNRHPNSCVISYTEVFIDRFRLRNYLNNEFEWFVHTVSGEYPKHLKRNEVDYNSPFQYIPACGITVCGLRKAPACFDLLWRASKSRRADYNNSVQAYLFRELQRATKAKIITEEQQLQLMKNSSNHQIVEGNGAVSELLAYNTYMHTKVENL